MMMMMTIIVTAKLDEMEEAAHQLFTVMQSQQQKIGHINIHLIRPCEAPSFIYPVYSWHLLGHFRLPLFATPKLHSWFANFSSHQRIKWPIYAFIPD